MNGILILLSLVALAIILWWVKRRFGSSSPFMEGVREKTIPMFAQPTKTDSLFKNLQNDEKALFRDEQKNGFCLIVENGHPARKKFVLIGTHIIVGRSPVNDVTVDDPMSSEKHFRMEFEQDQPIFLEDLGSTNGTYVNGKRIRKVELHDNDLIKIGRTELRFRKDAD